MAKRKMLKLTDPREVRKALARVTNMVLNNELDPRQANTIILACNAILSSIRTDELQRKVELLEAKMEDENLADAITRAWGNKN